MKRCIQAILLFVTIAGFTGCLSLGDTHEVYPPTLGRELGDLRTSLERGAISPQEYEQQKSQLMAGSHPRTRELLAGAPGQGNRPHDARRVAPNLQRQYAAPQYEQYPVDQAQYQQPQFDPQLQGQQFDPQMMQPQQFNPQAMQVPQQGAMPQEGMMQPGAMPQQQPQAMELPTEGWH